MKRIYSNKIKEAADYDMGAPTGLNYPGQSEKIIDINIDVPNASPALIDLIVEQFNGIAQAKVTYTDYTHHSDPEVIDVQPMLLVGEANQDVFNQLPPQYQAELEALAMDQAERVIEDAYFDGPYGPDDLIG